MVDNREFLKRLDPKIKQTFLEKKVMYVRTYHMELGLTWQRALGVSTEQEAEQFCRDNYMEFKWLDDVLQTLSVRDAIIPHPRTGDMCWVAQPCHWHPDSLNPELMESMLALYTNEELPRNCFYGDGTPIEKSIIQELEGLCEELEAPCQWQVGDVMLVDNISSAHARNPYEGERKLFVCVGEMFSFKPG